MDAWRVTGKEPAGTDAVTFTLEPADDTPPVTPAKPGQYVSVKVHLPDGLRQVRQYSLSGDAGTSRTFTTKLNDGGEVSTALHAGVEPGDILEISNPYGRLPSETVTAPSSWPLRVLAAPPPLPFCGRSLRRARIGRSWSFTPTRPSRTGHSAAR